jgi:hypothetical protein
MPYNQHRPHGARSLRPPGALRAGIVTTSIPALDYRIDCPREVLQNLGGKDRVPGDGGRGAGPVTPGT